jgi:hypothetical protein
MRHLHLSYSDLLQMPTFERRFYVNSLIEEFDKKNEAIEQANNKSKNRF